MADTTYRTWHTDPTAEAAMGDAHAPYWRHVIDIVPERDLSTRSVLDFGRSRDYYPSVLDALSYPDEHKLLFRLAKRR